MIDGIEALLKAFHEGEIYMRTRVNELYKLVCIPKPENEFILVDLEKGETVENKELEVSRRTSEKDIVVYFVT